MFPSTRMRGNLIVESQEAFEAWLEKQAADFPIREDDDNWKYWRD